jgi:hypothetical protein
MQEERKKFLTLLREIFNRWDLQKWNMPFLGGYPTISSEILLGELLSNNLPTMTNLKSY